MSAPTTPPAYRSEPERRAQGEQPIGLPYYGVGPLKAVARFFRKYVTFSGRASRSEYWWAVLFTVVVSIVLSFIWAGISGSSAGSTSGTPVFEFGVLLGRSSKDPLSIIFSLGVLLPSLAVAVRRLHDTNRSGWWYFLVLIPLVGPIILLVWFLLPAKVEGQRFDRR